MLDRLKAEAAVARRRDRPFSLLVIDIDHFKQVNDEYGHDTGDNVLIAIARAMTEGLRAYDVCARWGGEEFLALLPQTTGPDALEISNRLRSKIEGLAYPELPDSVRCSVSIGIAEHAAGADVTETVKRADTALYAAKRGGRNCIEVAGDR
jgi:diguanylate cyclase (GGDEF)-like protein